MSGDLHDTPGLSGEQRLIGAFLRGVVEDIRRGNDQHRTEALTWLQNRPLVLGWLKSAGVAGGEL